MEWLAVTFCVIVLLAALSSQVYKIFMLEKNPLPYRYNDGGRINAGFKKTSRDCVTRALAIVSGYSYMSVYRLVDKVSKDSPFKDNTADKGVNGIITDALMEAFGGVWFDVPKGTYFRKGTVPEKGVLVAQVKQHVVAVIDGVAYDNHRMDSKEELVGYWVFPSRTVNNVR